MRTAQRLEMERFEMAREQRGIVEHPVVINGPIPSGSVGDSEAGVETPRELDAVTTGEDRVSFGPEDVTRQLGGGDELDLVLAITRECPERSGCELDWVGQP